MMKNMRRGIPNLFKSGTKMLTGLEEAVIRNIQACVELGEMTRTSLGPTGMNKLIINSISKMFVTSDCATIMSEMEVEHPAAKMVVMASSMQEREIGDGSNFVICLAAELLQEAEMLIHKGLHPSQILAGYEKAGDQALKILDELSIMTVDKAGLASEETLAKCVYASIAAKQLNYADLLSHLVAKACLSVLPVNPLNFNVDNIRTVKLLGGDLSQSTVINGMVIEREPDTSTKAASDAKVAVFVCSIECADTETKGTAVMESAEDLMSFNLGEEKFLENIIKSLAESGVKVIVTGGHVDDMAFHFLEKYKIVCVRVPSKFGLRRLCRAIRARPIVSLGPVASKHLGFCSRVEVREIASKLVTVFSQAVKDKSGVTTIVLRASTKSLLDDVEKAVDDGINTIKALTKDGRMLPGAGACDIELALRLAAFGAKTSGLEQYSINAFAHALEIIPKVLAENAGFPSMDVISALYAAHSKKQTNAGIDIETGKVLDAEKANILDLFAAKQQGLKLATDVAITILRVDQIIMAKPAGGPRLGKTVPGAESTHWDDQDGE
eukprot:gb/GEZN01004443.1/.p1 GENE.gb/GEZN01004443.1/~~gb/GEZN01004443.1/.p1  ORF type:complete len:564 (-),score=109.66 gb/GEZN01004443.1/:275-1936(-)